MRAILHLHVSSPGTWWNGKNIIYMAGFMTKIIYGNPMTCTFVRQRSNCKILFYLFIFTHQLHQKSANLGINRSWLKYNYSQLQKKCMWSSDNGSKKCFWIGFAPSRTQSSTCARLLINTVNWVIISRVYREKWHDSTKYR